MIQRKTGNRFIILGLAITALVVVLGAFFLTRGSGGSSSRPPSSGTTAAVSDKTTNVALATQPIVVALQSIPSGTNFQEGQPLDAFFGVKQVPASEVPLGAYTSVQQIENEISSTGCLPRNQPGCIGHVTTTETIYQNLPVVSGMFSTLGAFRTQASPAYRIPYGYVALSVVLSDANSVSNSIQPGDTIDLMASYLSTTCKTYNAQPQTQFVMTNVKVVGVGTFPAPASANGPTASAQGANQQATAGSLIILARYQQALVVQHLKDCGWQISAVLRSARETSSIPHFRTQPVTDSWFFVKSTNPFKSNPGY